MWEYYYRPKKRKRKNKFLFFLFLVSLICVIVSLFITQNINPVLKIVSEEKVRAMTNNAINISAHEVIDNNFDYSDFINITLNSSGDISLMQVNSVLVNAIARKTVIDSQKLIDKIGEEGINVPVGSLSGIAIFAGKGPNVNLKIYQVGTILSQFESSFYEAGINQTRHTLSIVISSKVKVVIPGSKHIISTTSQIMLTESIIVGKVPNIYLGANSKLLDFTP